MISTHSEVEQPTQRFELLYREYNEREQMTLEIERQGEGQDLHREEYEFDSEGRKTREYKHFIQEEMEQTHRWTYDEQGRILTEIAEFEGGFQTVKHFAYGDGAIEIRITDEEGVEEGKETRTLDGEGREIERVEYDEEGTLKLHVTTEYNAVGKKTRVETRSWDDAFEDEWMYEYDEEGRLTVEKQLNQEGYIIMRRLNTLDEKGNVIEYVAEDLQRKEKLRRTYVLNEQGQVITEKAFMQDSEEPEATAVNEYEGELLVKKEITAQFYQTSNEYQRTFYSE
ncbi:MAG TPA: hypothetical protein DCE41_23540 [Cytophagales bacterium]|nr:hypothetical protein [Cytophagales bacterium]